MEISSSWTMDDVHPPIPWKKCVLKGLLNFQTHPYWLTMMNYDSIKGMINTVLINHYDQQWLTQSMKATMSNYD